MNSGYNHSSENVDSQEPDEGTHESSKTEEKSVKLLFSLASKTIDPHQDFIGVWAGIAETLVRINNDLEIEPWLAESWQQVDERTWVFTIRDGVSFHDGTPV